MAYKKSDVLHEIRRLVGVGTTKRYISAQLKWTPIPIQKFKSKYFDFDNPKSIELFLQKNLPFVVGVQGRIEYENRFTLQVRNRNEREVPSISHAMLAVDFEEESNELYLILKNSWSDRVVFFGYYRLCITKNNSFWHELSLLDIIMETNLKRENYEPDHPLKHIRTPLRDKVWEIISQTHVSEEIFCQKFFANEYDFEKADEIQTFCERWLPLRVRRFWILLQRWNLSRRGIDRRLDLRRRC